jgi:hypothetical protein
MNEKGGVMCGRFAYFGNGFYGYESLQVPEPPFIESYNIAPSQNILALRVYPAIHSIRNHFSVRLHSSLLMTTKVEDHTLHFLVK